MCNSLGMERDGFKEKLLKLLAGDYAIFTHVN